MSKEKKSREKVKELETKTGSYVWESGSKYGICKFIQMENIKKMLNRFIGMEQEPIFAILNKLNIADNGKWTRCPEKDG
jgi:hypothetical protein